MMLLLIPSCTYYTIWYFLHHRSPAQTMQKSQNIFWEKRQTPTTCAQCRFSLLSRINFAGEKETHTHRIAQIPCHCCCNITSHATCTVKHHTLYTVSMRYPRLLCATASLGLASRAALRVSSSSAYLSMFRFGSEESRKKYGKRKTNSNLNSRDNGGTVTTTSLISRVRCCGWWILRCYALGGELE